MHKLGIDCLVIDAAKFPRFVIGESLLSNCMTYLDEANMLKAKNLGFDSLRQVSFFDSKFVKYYILIDDFIICVVKRVKG